MPISTSQVRSLRARTGVSILACQSALEEAGGDEECAIEVLRKRGQAQAVKRAAREQSEGAVFSALQSPRAALVLLRCETDFVARSDDFRRVGQALATEALRGGEPAVKDAASRALPELVQKLGENICVGEVNVIEAPVLGIYVHPSTSSGQASKIGVLIGLQSGIAEIAHDIAMHAAAMNPKVTSPDQVSAEVVAKEKEIWREQLKQQGKPEAIWDKIMMGKEKKFREESALLTQPFAKDPSKLVEQVLGGVKVVAYVRLSVGE